MHIQRLQELIDEPGKTQLSDRDGLSDWVKKYPYAGAFSMLLARSSAVGGHIEQQADSDASGSIFIAAAAAV